VVAPPFARRGHPPNEAVDRVDAADVAEPVDRADAAEWGRSGVVAASTPAKFLAGRTRLLKNVSSSAGIVCHGLLSCSCMSRIVSFKLRILRPDSLPSCKSNLAIFSPPSPNPAMSALAMFSVPVPSLSSGAVDPAIAGGARVGSVSDKARSTSNPALSCSTAEASVGANTDISGACAACGVICDMCRMQCGAWDVVRDAMRCGGVNGLG
jgi:hypothetical protein